VYDVWGNLTNMNAVAGKTNYQNLQAAPASVKNQLNGHCHDAAGNLMRVGTCGSADYTYDAENRMVTAGGVTYTYDGDGRRVKKSNGKLYWYASGLDAIAESDLAGNNMEESVFFQGKRVARRKTNGAVEYYFADHLGTSRVVTNATGGLLDDQDFYPYGAIVPGGSSTSGQNYKFTGKERDESGLDYFIARHYGSNWGRFLQPDEFTGGPVDAFSSSDPLPPGPLPYAEATNPQSLNKYGYTYGNPLRYVDPDGHGVLDKVLKVLNGADIAATVLEVRQKVATVFDSGATIGQRAKAALQVASEFVGSAEVGVKPELSEKIAAGLAVTATLAGEKPVQPYEVGRASDLQKRSKGDDIDIHHAPQSHAGKQNIPGYDPDKAPAIALRQTEHQAMAGTNVRGTASMTPRQLAAKTMSDLKKHTSAPRSARKKLLELMKETYTLAK
jgi:RHS repeat-associated protein